MSCRAVLARRNRAVSGPCGSDCRGRAAVRQGPLSLFSGNTPAPDCQARGFDRTVKM
ncbi:Hypothetical protein I596_460 [Dokdonella koreensis DS-123]|uniref:Uncharacterized protein n=1 Tax=Dokdonella koreensis DS-123 TaxID=1300342 RepID=A0A167GFE7_9GAMM|nr:Hypothetical protein I596_460 [Dokdonella koreensis DS-123]